MPIRAVGITLLALGFAAVLILFLIRRDPRASAERGPRWKRRLLTAGLVALSSIGLAPAYCQAVYGPPPPDRQGVGPTRPATLEESAEYRRIQAVQAEAAEIASGKRGQYPFDREGKDRVLKDLARARDDAKALAAQGLLSRPEADLLEADLDAAVTAVAAFRTKDLVAATCYEPMPLTAGHDALRRIEARLSALERLADAKTLHPEVLRKSIEAVKADLAILENRKKAADLQGEARARADDAVRRAKDAIDRVERRLSGATDAGPDPDWTRVTEALARAAEMSKRGTKQAERVEIHAALAEAKAALARLSASGRIAAGEAALLSGEADHLEAAIRENPPIDSEETCYKAVLLRPEKKSLDRLEARLPLLERLVKEGRVHPDVVAKLLPAIEADLAVLSAGSLPSSLSPDERKKAADTRTRIDAALKTLRAALEKAK